MDSFAQSLMSGQITPVNSTVFCFLSVLVGMAGGALGGIKVGGAALGNSMAAMVGAFFGVTAALPSTILGLITLALIGK